MKLFGTMKINDYNHLEIGGIDVIDLAKKYKTPLYVMDQQLIEDNMKLMKERFASNLLSTEVIYASKAFLNLAMCQLVDKQGLSLDVVSGGELYTAQKAGFPMEKVYFHGNNKQREELEMAVDFKVGTIILDNEDEIELLTKTLMMKNQKIRGLLRVNPGIEAHTHQYIQTSKHSSKFGESIFDENTLKIMRSLADNPYIDFRGFHCHIGSQIFDSDSFIQASGVMLDFIKMVEQEIGFKAQELNLGGGFGVYYEAIDTPLDLEDCLSSMISLLETSIREKELSITKVMIEPGRSIVANSGVTIYKAGGIKRTYSGEKFVFVDGGMTDNPRPALYQAVYEAAIANRMVAEDTELVTIAGKCCESGDVLIENIVLPEVAEEDFIVVFTTGAYNYSMASNYNRISRPPVIMVKDAVDKLIVRRESYEDLLKNDIAIDL